MTIQEIKNQIEKLIRKAESGADWAEICRLEQLAIDQRSMCDVCDERPWEYQAVVCGIQTSYCEQCSNG